MQTFSFCTKDNDGQSQLHPARDMIHILQMLATVKINFCLVLHGYTASTRVDVTYIGFVVISVDDMGFYVSSRQPHWLLSVNQTTLLLVRLS